MIIFSDLSLRPELQASVEATGYARMTPVQAQSLPLILEGRDVLAQAQTGSGKTAAFGLGLLQHVVVETATLQALVLCPTRELAEQVSQALRQLATTLPNVKLLTLCGGAPMRAQLASLSHPPHIVVGTPGRILAHLARDSLDTSGLHTLVLDEADRMLDMGFAEDIDAIVRQLPQQRQTLLFSATWPDDIRAVSRRLQHKPVDVIVASAAASAPAIEQRFHELRASEKTHALATILGQLEANADRSGQALVFCNTKVGVDEVAAALNQRGFTALPLHGDRDQRDRDEVLLRFVNQSCTVLVATDVAARGLDIPALPLVVSYDIARDPDTHLHRIGRTGRAGVAGVAITLCEPNERYRAERLFEASSESLSWQRLPADNRNKPAAAPMITLRIDGGRKDKLRPGDILGALTGDAGLDGQAIGKIDLYPTRAYVAVARKQSSAALARLREGRIKGRRFRIHEVRG